MAAVALRTVLRKFLVGLLDRFATEEGGLGLEVQGLEGRRIT